MAKPNLSQNEVLDRFLADNPELEELSAKLSVFNIFRTLKVEKAEIRHSNVLAWLLDPSESHGLSDIVLRRILSNMLLESDTNIKGISAAQVELMGFNSVEVLREWNNIDIVVVDRGNEFVVLIENKIYSKESKGQLAKYLKILNAEFPSFKKLPIFLTLMGDEVEDEQIDDYLPYSYSQVLTVLEQIFSQRESQLAKPVAIFLRQYMDILRKLTMQDEKLISLCKTIYQKHRDAIDLIVEYGMVGAGHQAVEDILTEDGDYEILDSRTNEVWFIPRRWAAYIPENCTVRKHLNRPVSVGCFFYFSRNRQRVRFIWSVSAMDDSKLRLRCIKALKEAGFKPGKLAFREDAKYSHFYSESLKVSDLTDQEEVSDAARKLLNKGKAKFAIAEKVFSKVFKS